MMMKAVFLLLWVVATPGWGQTGLARNDAVATFFTAPDKVLPRLYVAAAKHSAALARLDARKGVANEDLKLSRKHLLNIVSVVSSYNYGSLPYFATADVNGGSRPAFVTNPFSQGARAVYTVGMNLVMPLDMLAGRRSTVHRQELIVTEAEAERNDAEMQVRIKVIEQYQALTLAHTVVQHYQDALQSANVNKKITDKRFREGEIKVDEQLNAIDFYNRAVLTEAEAKSKYQTALLLMENMIGGPINTLMTEQ